MQHSSSMGDATNNSPLSPALRTAHDKDDCQQLAQGHKMHYRVGKQEHLRTVLAAKATPKMFVVDGPTSSIAMPNGLHT
jgi:hypothetical protein